MRLLLLLFVVAAPLLARANTRDQAALIDACRAHTSLLLTHADNTALSRSLTTRADLARTQGDLPGAFTDALSALKLTPSYAPAFLSLADTWYAVGNLQQAQDHLTRARQLDSSISRSFTSAQAARHAVGKTEPLDSANTSAEFTAAVTAQKNQDFSSALAAYDHILALKPNNAPAWGNRGNTLSSLNRPAFAIISYSRALTIATTQGMKPEAIARYFNNRLNAWLDLGDFDAALLDGQLSTRIFPEGPLGWQRLAYATYLFGDFEKTQSFLAEAVKRDPSYEPFAVSKEGAHLNSVTRRARTGDLTALADLIDLAANTRAPSFQENTQRATALAILTPLLEKRPRDIDLLILRAQLENVSASGIKLGTDEAAFPWIDQALAINPDHPRALLTRGLLRLGLYTDDSSIKNSGYSDLARAFKLGASSARSHALLAAHASDENDFASAISHYTAALRLTPEDLPLLGHRARAYAHLKKWPQALADHQRHISQSDEKHHPLSLRADTYTDSADYPRALADYASALSLAPKNPDYFLGRARTYRLQGEFDLSRADFQQARTLDPTLPALDEDWANASDIEALRHDFKHALGRVSSALNAVHAATSDLAKASQIQAHDEARALRRNDGDNRTAEQIITEVTGYEKNTVADAEDYCDLASALRHLERFDEAITACNKADTLAPDNASIHSIRGRIYEAKNDNNRAFADYDRAITLNPANASHYCDRGDIHWKRDNYPAAHVDYDAAVTLESDNPTNWLKRANARLMLNQISDAIADYNHVLQAEPDNELAKKNLAIARLHLPKK